MSFNLPVLLVRKQQKRKYKVKTDRYYSIYKPYHPYSNKYGRVLEHRYVYHLYLSIKYNRIIYLPKSYDVHHKNKNKTDNRIENLELLNKSEHMFKDSRVKDRICNICYSEKSLHKKHRVWYNDISGFICLLCYVHIVRLKHKLKII